MSHETFDIIEEPSGVFTAVSHNFPDHFGSGVSRDVAIDLLNRSIMYLANNDPKGFAQKVQGRIEKGLQCECGYKLTERPLAVQRG